MAKQKELGSKRATSSREASFGKFPEHTSASKSAHIDNFGHKIRGASVWPPAAASVDQKSGFPENRKM